MRQNETDTAVRREHRNDQVAHSFLVRVWYESREPGEGEPSFRGYLRNLQTGEERFLRAPASVAEEIVRQGAPAADDRPRPPARRPGGARAPH